MEVLHALYPAVWAKVQEQVMPNVDEGDLRTTQKGRSSVASMPGGQVIDSAYRPDSIGQYQEMADKQEESIQKRQKESNKSGIGSPGSSMLQTGSQQILESQQGR